MKKLFTLTMAMISISVFASAKNVKVIYGNDNRVDVIDSTNSMYVELSRSTAAMISKARVSAERNGEIKINGSMYARDDKKRWNNNYRSSIFTKHFKRFNF